MNQNIQSLSHSEEIIERQTAKQIIKQVIPDIFIEKEQKPSEFINTYWQKYINGYESNQNINGKVFEELIAICLIREGILPFYMQAKVAFISYVNYDFILYTEDIGPISLSAKTSLRERWKQADLEAVALKYIHRKSQSYLITMDTEAVKRRRIDSSQTLGINEFIIANSDEFNVLIQSIKSYRLQLSPTVQVVSSNIVITAENIELRYK